MSSWAFPCGKAKKWQWMPFSTLFRLPPLIAKNWRSRELFSVPLARRSTITRNWCVNISAPWCRGMTTSLPRLMRRWPLTVRLFMCLKACAARWNFPPIFALTRKKPGSLSAPFWWPTKTATSATLKAVPLRCATAISYTRRWWKSSSIKTPR